MLTVFVLITGSFPLAFSVWTELGTPSRDSCMESSIVGQSPESTGPGLSRRGSGAEAFSSCGEPVAPVLWVGAGAAAVVLSAGAADFP